ncbi:hypothetical protein ACJX0J_034824, partial [Zea mays]
EQLQKVLDAGISIKVWSISAYGIGFLLLSGHCIAIALVDKLKLKLRYWQNIIITIISKEVYHAGVIMMYNSIMRSQTTWPSDPAHTRRSLSHPVFRRQLATVRREQRAPVPLPRSPSPSLCPHIPSHDTETMTTHTAEELATQIEQQKLEEQKTELRDKIEEAERRKEGWDHLGPLHQLRGCVSGRVLAGILFPSAENHQASIQ